MKNKLAAFLFVAIIMIAALFTVFSVNPVNAQVPMPDLPTLDPSSIPKYVDQLVIPPVYVPQYTYDHKNHLWQQEYKVTMSESTNKSYPQPTRKATPQASAEPKSGDTADTPKMPSLANP